ncbi:UNKNOWN [Stylonychia lemnae]|uniref:Protein kinase domain-containing protein n=1 Tax=Stylonychia lemnae TaxID=5949 RepID=A0A078BC91_STYLE|nr:UNKNOWN [Stylonychia lemnae]|eukprot:CDW90857.1 UNKNOWN [Stylonychia lemnae]
MENFELEKEFTDKSALYINNRLDKRFVFKDLVCENFKDDYKIWVEACPNPNIVQAFDFQPQTFLKKPKQVTEFIQDGQSCRKFIQFLLLNPEYFNPIQKMKKKMLLLFLSQMCKTIQECHKRRLYHLNLNLSNVIVQYYKESILFKLQNFETWNTELIISDYINFKKYHELLEKRKAIDNINSDQIKRLKDLKDFGLMIAEMVTKLYVEEHSQRQTLIDSQLFSPQDNFEYQTEIMEIIAICNETDYTTETDRAFNQIYLIAQRLMLQNFIQPESFNQNYEIDQIQQAILHNIQINNRAIVKYQLGHKKEGLDLISQLDLQAEFTSFVNSIFMQWNMGLIFDHQVASMIDSFEVRSEEQAKQKRDFIENLIASSLEILNYKNTLKNKLRMIFIQNEEHANFDMSVPSIVESIDISQNEQYVLITTDTKFILKMSKDAEFERVYEINRFSDQNNTLVNKEVEQILAKSKTQEIIFEDAAPLNEGEPTINIENPNEAEIKDDTIPKFSIPSFDNRDKNNTQEDIEQFQSFASRKTEYDPLIDKIISADINNLGTHVLVYQFNEKRNYKTLIIFELKNDNSEYVRYKLDDILDEKSYNILEIKFAPHREKNILLVRTDEFKKYVIDVEKKIIMSTSDCPMLDKSIFRKKKEFNDYFDDVKQFINDNKEVGNKISIPEENTEIILGFDAKSLEFFIYNIKERKITRKFQLVRKISLFNGKDQKEAEINSATYDMLDIYSFKARELIHMQLSSCGTYFVAMIASDIFKQNIAIDQEALKKLQPIYLMVDYRQSIYSNKLKLEDKQNLLDNNAKNQVQKLEQQYGQVKVMQQSSLADNKEHYLKMQQNLDECLILGEEVFKNKAAFEAFREFQTITQNVRKEDFQDLYPLGQFNKNSFIVVNVGKKIICLDYHKNSRTFEVAVHGVDELMLIDKENIVLVRCQNQLQMYSIPELTKKFVKKKEPEQYHIKRRKTMAKFLLQKALENESDSDHVDEDQKKQINEEELKKKLQQVQQTDQSQKLQEKNHCIKILVYYVTVEEEEIDLQQDYDSNESDHDKVIEEPETIHAINCKLHWEYKYLSNLNNNLGYLINIEFDLLGDKFLSIYNYGEITMWDMKNKQRQKEIGIETQNISHIKMLTSSQRILMMSTKPSFIIFNSASEKAVSISINSKEQRVCQQFECEITETFALALFQSLFVFNIQKSELTRVIKLNKLDQNTRLIARMDELCSYLVIMDDRQRAFDFYLMGYKNYVKKIEPPIEKYEPPPQIILDNPMDKIRNEKSSCCNIF